MSDAPKPVEAEEELLEVIDAQGRVVGLRRRAEIHGDPAARHRAVHVFVRNRHGALFLQRRAPTKRIQPDRWDTSVGGHVDPGESYEQAAVRELAEELGVRLAAGAPRAALEHLHDYVWRTAVETEHVRTFALTHEGPFTLHPEEISAGRFFAAEELQRLAGGGELTPNLEEELRRLGLLPAAPRTR